MSRTVVAMARKELQAQPWVVNYRGFFTVMLSVRQTPYALYSSMRGSYV